MTPTARTLAELRKRGYLAAVVEKWNVHARVRNDLFGFVDVIALKGEKTLAVQATSGSNVSSRIAKIRESLNLPLVLAAGWRVAVWGWRKNSAGRWVLREEEVSE